jgi:hypothetical protein
MLNHAFLLSALLLASADSLAKPSTELPEALRLAEAYVSEHKISNSHRYVASVSWHYEPGRPERSCWSVMWLPDELEFDGQLVVWVCSDGRISHQAGGWA